MDYYNIKNNLEQLTKMAENKLNDVPKEKGYLRAAVTQQIENLRELPKRYELTEYRLVFMGKQGCGKTTTIMNLCGLFQDDLPGNKINEVSLLPTGSGGTTAAETIELHQTVGGGTYFLVTCCSKKELREKVSSYIEDIYTGLLNEYLKGKENDNKENELRNEKKSLLPIEIKRCIANMCKEKLMISFTEKHSDSVGWCGEEYFEVTTGAYKPNAQERLERFITYAINQKNRQEHVFETGDIDNEFVKKLTVFIINNWMAPFYESILEADDVEIEIKKKADGINIKEFLQDTANKLNNGSYEHNNKKITLAKKWFFL